MNIQINGWIDDEYHGKTITNATITDDNGVTWEYDAYAYTDGHRELRIPEADKEYPEEHQAENGYDARSIDEALLILVDGGYILNNIEEVLIG